MKKLIFFILSVWMVSLAQAKVKPASLFNDGMVLQQQSKVKIWGWSQPNKTITISGTWNKQKVRTTANNQGQWEAYLQTPKGSFTPYEVNISDGEKLTIHNVLIGEVWLGSGQSNMEMPLVGYYSCPIENLNDVVIRSTAYTGKLHFVTVGHQTPSQPVDSVKAPWKDCTPENVWNCSATCYFFATSLINALNVPVGVINSSWGGTKVECWTPEEQVKTYSNIDLSEEKLKKADWDTPITRYNGMIHPIKGYTLKGFIWYQGEANLNEPELYKERLPNMIQTWRKLWNNPQAPFYFVEVAPYEYGDRNAINAAKFRTAQHEIAHNVENSGVICTNDLVYDYEINQIHPCMKKEVGERLSLLALQRTYGIKGLMADAPEFQKMDINDGKAYISFSQTDHGFNRFGEIKGFEIAGADKKFYPANAWLNDRHIVVSAPEVNSPVAVRYGYRNFLPGNLKNIGGQPVVPFRTDNWD